MSSGAHKGGKLDTLMEQASKALVRREYFNAEHLALSALRKAHAAHDYDRMARILLPLQEARRQKRDLALDAAERGRVFLVDADVPSGKRLTEGCYLVAPPRVGLDGRLLRESADRREVPVIVMVREPTTRDGLWPLVALGPVTVRTKVKPPPEPKPPKGKAKAAPKKGVAVSAKPGKPDPKSAKAADDAPMPQALLPSPAWFALAGEALGDAAIASVPETLAPSAQVDALMEFLETLPDHEKLHQRLADAARAAAKMPAKPAPVRRPAAPEELDPEHD